MATVDLGSVIGPQGPKGDKGDPGEVTQAEFDELSENKADIIVSSASGAIASFPDGAESTAKKLVVSIEPVQEGTGDPAPDNVRPISGWTGVKVTVSPTTDAEDGQTYDIALPTEAGTVYGGTLDVTTGVLTVEKYGIVVNGSNHRFEDDDGDGYWHILPHDYPTIKTVSEGTAPTLVYSDITVGIAKWGTTQNGTVMFTRASDWTGVFNSVDELNAIGITVVYELATPITYHLTPQEITTLLGQNNIWADTGDTSVTYRADTKLYIDKKFAELQALILEK